MYAWIICWISPDGQQLTGLLDGSESDAMIEACKLHREGARVRRIDGPLGQIITYGEVVRFYETHLAVPTAAHVWQKAI